MIALSRSSMNGDAITRLEPGHPPDRRRHGVTTAWWLALYPRWANFFRPDDVIMTDSGTSSLGLAFAQLPNGAEFHNQILWASIAWATPAAFGAAIGASDRRLVLITKGKVLTR